MVCVCKWAHSINSLAQPARKIISIYRERHIISIPLLHFNVVCATSVPFAWSSLILCVLLDTLCRMKNERNDLVKFQTTRIWTKANACRSNGKLLSSKRRFINKCAVFSQPTPSSCHPRRYGTTTTTVVQFYWRIYSTDKGNRASPSLQPRKRCAPRLLC